MKFDINTPSDSEQWSVTLARLFANDQANQFVDDAAVLAAGLARGNVVKWSGTNARWEKLDGTVQPAATDIIGVVEFVSGTAGTVRTGGVYVDPALAANTLYYVQGNGTLGTTATKVLVGRVTAGGRLVMAGSLVPASGVPSGTIAYWNGSIATIPGGWLLCDGTNGTTNLLGVFLLGAGGSYAVDATGGETTHTLSIAEMPTHSHPITFCSYNQWDSYGLRPANGNFWDYPTTVSPSAGGGGAHNNMPPYRAKAPIMKV